MVRRTLSVKTLSILSSCFRSMIFCRSFFASATKRSMMSSAYESYPSSSGSPVIGFPIFFFFCPEKRFLLPPWRTGMNPRLSGCSSSSSSSSSSLITNPSSSYSLPPAPNSSSSSSASAS